MADKIQVHKKFVWKLHEMTKEKIESCKSKEKLESASTKIVIGDIVTEWCLRVYFGGQTEKYKDWVSLYLILKGADSSSFKACYTLGIARKNGNREEKYESSGDSFDKGRGLADLLKRADFLNPNLGYLVGGSVTLYCELTITAEKVPECDELALSNPNQLGDFKRMLYDEIFTDYEIETSDKKILKVHKCVLAFRSPPFHDLLAAAMKDTKGNIVKVTEDSAVIKEVLRFIYGANEVENLSMIACKLVVAAAKYQLDGLKQICLAHIFKTLNTENVLQAVLAADRLTSSKGLKSKCIEMIARNFESLSTTDEWEKLSPGLLTELMHKMNQEMNDRDTIYL